MKLSMMTRNKLLGCFYHITKSREDILNNPKTIINYTLNDIHKDLMGNGFGYEGIKELCKYYKSINLDEPVFCKEYLANVYETKLTIRDYLIMNKGKR